MFTQPIPMKKVISKLLPDLAFGDEPDVFEQIYHLMRDFIKQSKGKRYPRILYINRKQYQEVKKHPYYKRLVTVDLSGNPVSIVGMQYEIRNGEMEVR